VFLKSGFYLATSSFRSSVLIQLLAFKIWLYFNLILIGSGQAIYVNQNSIRPLKKFIINIDDYKVMECNVIAGSKGTFQGADLSEFTVLSLSTLRENRHY
jgi:hypothetical protein